jgi:uncharacterized protein (DUF1810 family)
LDDQYNLHRFVIAQKPVFEQAIFELKAGRKVGHWMWYIFPQIHDLGSSHTAREFAISSLAEAEAYLKHSILGSRLTSCTQLVIDANRAFISEIFHHPDDLKFGSSMTLFQRADPGVPAFKQALEKYFGGIPDRRTLERL